jgi:hypothetical protein
MRAIGYRIAHLSSHPGGSQGLRVWRVPLPMRPGKTAGARGRSLAARIRGAGMEIAFSCGILASLEPQKEQTIACLSTSQH